ncbi:MAG: hypothetical protein UU95_C0018G0014 [Parcubacteria group bacterium GW2011_GWC2_42_12]|uniref:WavE lipopolysaccharide synthesis n=1 Tax=Candidatus Falkowbacteria bacterium RIFCSPHIGHO2_02_FULL_42_9 TaxID=1797986 RepID=A0A1F5SA45_9BACT|nr:MAG: hypothetical protein UU95_C0018G0014 [Parcubacteria group bacterium GW2011_GWC2_42_12]OGF23588.1 MAG: hypothetical protein A3D45_02290 [Candidatus Falkowbacteria bacterium RIFCSPHIGHO2_02_FULL_42_9]
MLYKIKKFIPANFKRKLKDLGIKIIFLFLNIVEPLTGKFVSFSTRPIRASGISILSVCPEENYSEYTIVMQGPIVTKYRFTLETLLIYKKLFPGAFIVLSTWEGGDTYTIEAARGAGLEVIINKKPIPGLFNVNMQTVSAMAGLRLAAKLNKKYALKVRADQRIYNSESLTFFSNLLKNFPLTVSGSKLKGRIIATGAYNFKIKQKIYNIYESSPIFGYLEDVMLFFGADLISNNPPPLEFLKKYYPNSPFMAEGYIFTEFLKKIGHQPENTPEDYLRCLARYCILIDAMTLGWYWFKYKRFIECQNLGLTYEHNGHLAFTDWLNLYNYYK